MLQNILEIFLITYNRAESLDSTLRKLKDSPFTSCRFTVLDNCSTDNTPRVAERYRECFDNYRIVRHHINIGGDANYLRAVELSRSRFTWIICDDDSYDFAAAAEVFTVLEKNSSDLVIVGPVHPSMMTRGVTGLMGELVNAGFLPHFTISFFPAAIFRTDLFDYDSLVKGFRLSANRYPNFAFINKMVEKNVRVFIPSREIVIRNDVNDSVLSPLSWYNGWITCCLTINDRNLRIRTMKQATAKRGFFPSLCFWIILERHINRAGYVRNLLNIFSLLPMMAKLSFLLLFPVMVIPLPLGLMVWVRKVIYRLMRVPDHEVPPVTVVDRDV